MSFCCLNDHEWMITLILVYSILHEILQYRSNSNLKRKFTQSFTFTCIYFFSVWLQKMFKLCKHAPLIHNPSWNCATGSEIPNHSHVVTWGTAAPLYQCSVRRWHMMDFRAVLFPSLDCGDCLGRLVGPWQAGPPPCLTLINIQRCPLNPSWAVTTRLILGFLYHSGWCDYCCW